MGSTATTKNLVQPLEIRFIDDSDVSTKEYVLELCTATQDSGESLGAAVRIDSSISKFNIQATKVIHGILTFSPAPRLDGD